MEQNMGIINHTTTGLLETHFDNHIWDTILHLGERLVFPAGTIITHNKYKGIFFIKKGVVCLSYFSNNGKEIKALYYNRKSIFNEARTFSEMNYECSFVCVKECELYFFKKEIFHNNEFIKKYPYIVQNLLKTLSDKVLIHYYALTGLRADNDVTNVSRFILDLYVKNGKVNTFKIAYNQQDIADMLGVHRTTVARTIRFLKESGALFQLSRYTVAISDIEVLKRITGGTF